MSPQPVESSPQDPDTTALALYRVSFDEAFALIVDGLTRNLALAQQVHDAGRRRTAAEYVIGALDELAPELATIRTVIRRA